ncbi:MAG: hypothetical protein KGI69_01790 [Patescibacteria group bacterium]|nr:hypothetical protein [Patescibacteria group bacterium]
MSKTGKIIIGAIIAAAAVGAGYVFMKSRNNGAASQNAGGSASQSIIMGTGDPYDQQHLQRTLNSGGTPGDGGGG